jgi:polyribonucleotide nucleotidyltransferase
MADTDTQIDVNDDGLVSVSSVKVGGSDEAIKWIEGLVKVVEPGEIYDGKVERIEGYGAFVNILPNKSGLVHVSSMAEEFVKDPNEIVKIGDEVKVRVKKVDDMGRIDLSMILDPTKEKKDSGKGGGRGGGRSGGFSRGRSFGGGRDRGRGGNRFGGRDKSGGRRFNQNRGGSGRKSSSDRSSGPHFPTSRLLIQDDKKR